MALCTITRRMLANVLSVSHGKLPKVYCRGQRVKCTVMVAANARWYLKGTTAFTRLWHRKSKSFLSTIFFLIQRTTGIDLFLPELNWNSLWFVAIHCEVFFTGIALNHSKCLYMHAYILLVWVAGYCVRNSVECNSSIPRNLSPLQKAILNVD